MNIFLALCLLGVAQATSYLVVCKQEQRPKPLVRFLPTSAAALATMDIQTAVPYEGNVTTLPGTWSFEEVKAGTAYVGLAGVDEISGVGFLSFEIAASKFSTAQGLVGVLSPALAVSNNWVYSSYLDWASCLAGPQSANTQIGTLNGFSFPATMTTKSALVALAQKMGTSALSPQMASMALSPTFPSGRSSISWDISVMCVDMPTCNLVGKTNQPPGPSGDRFICQLSVVPTARALSSATGRASSYFAWKDLQLGQSLASSKHILAQYCDLFLTSAPKPLDVLFSIDNSGSMASWQAAVAELGNAIAAVLGSTGIDWRIGLVTSAHYDNYAPGTCKATSCATLAGVTDGTYTCRYFTTNINLVKAWLTQGQTTWVGAGGPCGTGTEMTMFCVQMMFTSPPGVPNAAQSFMPRTAQTVASLAPNTAFRQATNALVVFLGDADDQYYGGSTSASASTGITLYLNFFLSMRSQFNGGLFFAGIICPDTQACGETQRSPRVIRSVLNQFPDSVIGAITSTASIQATLDLAIKKIVAQSSPYILTQPSAISASVQVLLDASKVLGPNCNNSNNEIPRSRVDGFDVESGRIILYGGCRPSSNLQPLVANYYYWVLTQCGDGIVQTDGGSGGEQCDPLVKSTTDCCDDNCKFITSPTFRCIPPGGSSCGSGNQTCSSSGVCTSTSCPDYCVACGETTRNFCTVSVGCTNNACTYRNRTCTPLGCNKRICSRTTPNSLQPGLMGECVPISAEQGYICDTDYCKLDACGWCNGDNSTCKGCDGNIPPPGGQSLKVDICGVCGGDGTTCCSCRPSEQNPKVCGPFAAKYDSCQVCDGNDRSCVNCNSLVCSLYTSRDPVTGALNSFTCTTDSECITRGATYCGTAANVGQKLGQIGYCVTACLNGTQGVDACGKCNGDGTSCLPTFDIQVNFATLDTTGTPECLSASPPCNCAVGDICCQLDWSFSTALKTLYPNALLTDNSVTCSAKLDRCDPLADTTGICVCDPTPTDNADPLNPKPCSLNRCCYSYTMKIQQVLLEGQTVTNVGQLINLLTSSGSILTSTSYGLNQIGATTTSPGPAPLMSTCGTSCTIKPTTTVSNPTGGCCVNRACASEISVGGYTQSQCNLAGGTFLLGDATCSNTRCATVTPPSVAPPATSAGLPPGVKPVEVVYTFPVTANSQLTPLAQDTLLKQTITELITQGLIPPPPAGVDAFTYYTGTVTLGVDGKVTVDVYPASGSWPTGNVPVVPVGTPVNPPICTINTLCTGKTAPPKAATSQSAGGVGASCDCTPAQVVNCGCDTSLKCVGNQCVSGSSAVGLSLF